MNTALVRYNKPAGEPFRRFQSLALQAVRKHVADQSLRDYICRVIHRVDTQPLVAEYHKVDDGHEECLEALCDAYSTFRFKMDDVDERRAYSVLVAFTEDILIGSRACYSIAIPCKAG